MLRSALLACIVAALAACGDGTHPTGGEQILADYNSRFSSAQPGGTGGTTAPPPAAETLGEKNVAACKRLVTALKCGTIDVTSQVDCNQYLSAQCDLVAYFDCLTPHYVCVNGTFDLAKLMSASTCPMAPCK